MLAGTATADITPSAGVELMGFALREQPSTHVIDPLQVRVLYLDDGSHKSLFINLDLIGLHRSAVAIIRMEIQNLLPDIGSIMIFCTHTHSGPGTAPLNGCGEPADGYVENLIKLIPPLSVRASESAVNCRIETGQTPCNLGVNRRNEESRNLALGVLRWVSDEQKVVAALILYDMHPVMMKSQGISADYPGLLCRNIQAIWKGSPVVFFGLKPCGDIDPPGVGVELVQMKEYVNFLQSKVLSLKFEDCNVGRLWSDSVEVRMPDWIGGETEVHRYADRYLSEERWHQEFGPGFRVAVERWRRSMVEFVSNVGENRIIEMSLLDLGPVRLLFVNAELFSSFSRMIKARIKEGQNPVWIISCANGMEGYIPDKEAWTTGGYEIETAPFFYNLPPPVFGFLEFLAEQAPIK